MARDKFLPGDFFCSEPTVDGEAIRAAEVDGTEIEFGAGTEMASGLLHERFEGELVQLFRELRGAADTVAERSDRARR